MNFTLLGTLIYAVEARIGAAKREGKEYCFIEIKRHILDVYRNQVGAYRDDYSKEISSHFGKLGAKKKKEKREARQKFVIVLNEVLQTKKIQEANEFWLQEKIREGKLELSPEGDVVYLEDEED